MWGEDEKCVVLEEDVVVEVFVAEDIVVALEEDGANRSILNESVSNKGH